MATDVAQTKSRRIKHYVMQTLRNAKKKKKKNQTKIKIKIPVLINVWNTYYTPYKMQVASHTFSISCCSGSLYFSYYGRNYGLD